jgi:hypothetical protein
MSNPAFFPASPSKMSKHFDELPTLSLQVCVVLSTASQVLAEHSLAMIFLKDNVLLERPLQPDDIKHRLLGEPSSTGDNINTDLC